MAIQWGKMILYGILSAVFYIAVPLVLFYVLDEFNIMTFSESFKTSILVFGIIGVVISMLRHAFPEDTSANRLIRFGITVYSGIFLFYIFGGFEPGRTLGTYSIDYISPMISIQAFLGLQLIAWLFLGSTIIRGLQYLIEAIELRKKKEYRVTVKKEFRVSKIFKVLGIIASLAILGYFGSIIYSGLNLDFNLHTPMAPPAYDAKNPLDPLDDSLNLTLTFDVGNAGIYAINNATLNAELFTVETGDNLTLPWHTKIGGSPFTYQKTFHSFTNTVDQDIIISIFPDYIVGLNSTNADLLLKLSFSTTYAGIFIALNVSLPFSTTYPII